MMMMDFSGDTATTTTNNGLLDTTSTAATVGGVTSEHLQSFVNTNMTGGIQTNRIVLFTRDNGGGLKNSIINVDPMGNVKNVRDLDVSGVINANGGIVGTTIRLREDPLESDHVVTKGYVDTLFETYKQDTLSRSLCDTNFNNNVDSTRTLSTLTPLSDSNLLFGSNGSTWFNTTAASSTTTSSLTTSSMVSHHQQQPSHTNVANMPNTRHALFNSDRAMGLNPKQAVLVATVEPLPSCEPFGLENGGIGSGLRATLPSVFPSIDSVESLVVGDRILVKNELNLERNGVYYIQDLGSSERPWTLVRTSDYDQPQELPLGCFFVKTGQVNRNVTYVNTTRNVGSVGFTNVVFECFTSVGDVKPGRGLARDANELRVNNDVETLSVSKATNKLRISPNYQGQDSISIVGKLRAGEWCSPNVIATRYGGTGLGTLPKGRFLVGNGTDAPIDTNYAVPRGNVVGTQEPQQLENKVLVDSSVCFQDSGNTRRACFSLIDVSPNTIRTYILPNANTHLLGHDNVANVSHKNFDSTNEVIANQLRGDTNATVVRIVGTTPPSIEGLVLTTILADPSQQSHRTDGTATNIVATWRKPETSLDFQNMGEVGVGIFRQKLEGGLVNLKRLYSTSPRLTIEDSHHKERILFDVNESALDLNRIGSSSSVLSVARGGTGLASLPHKRVLIGMGDKLEPSLVIPSSAFVGIDDQQELTRKVISGMKNEVSASGLVLNGKEYRLLQDRSRPMSAGDVLTISSDGSGVTFRPLPEPPGMSLVGNGVSAYLRTHANTHFFRTMSGGHAIDVSINAENQIVIGLKPSSMNLNDAMGLPLKVDRGGTGLKRVTPGKLLAGSPNDDSSIVSLDRLAVPMSDFVGVKDRQELENKTLMSLTNVVGASFINTPAYKMQFKGDTDACRPQAGEILTCGIEQATNAVVAVWRPPPRTLSIRMPTIVTGNGSSTARFIGSKDTSSMDILEIRVIRPDNQGAVLVNDTPNNEIELGVDPSKLDINTLGGEPLNAIHGGTGSNGFPAGTVLLGGGVGAPIMATKMAPRSAFVGTVDQQTLENKVLSYHQGNCVVTASFLRAINDEEISIDLESPPEVGYVFKIVSPGVAGWRNMSDDNPEVQRYQALFKPTVAAVETLKAENQALKTAVSKLNLHLNNIMEKLATLESRLARSNVTTSSNSNNTTGTYDDQDEDYDD